MYSLRVGLGSVCMCFLSQTSPSLQVPHISHSDTYTHFILVHMAMFMDLILAQPSLPRLLYVTGLVPAGIELSMVHVVYVFIVFTLIFIINVL